MKNIFSNWNFMRALRMILGIIIVVQGIQASEFMYAIAGILLSGMAIANIGCCGVGGVMCPIVERKKNKTIKKLVMKKFINDNQLYLIGALVGGLAGFFYWKMIGCSTGTCMITSSPIRSTLYFGLMGALFLGIFKKEKNAEQL